MINCRRCLLSFAWKCVQVQAVIIIITQLRPWKLKHYCQYYYTRSCPQFGVWAVKVCVFFRRNFDKTWFSLRKSFCKNFKNVSKTSNFHWYFNGAHFCSYRFRTKFRPNQFFLSPKDQVIRNDIPLHVSTGTFRRDIGRNSAISSQFNGNVEAVEETVDGWHWQCQSIDQDDYGLASVN